MIRLGCLGYGAWGRNLARVAASTPGATLVALAELDADKRAQAADRLPGTEIVARHEEVLEREIGTSAVTHTDLALATIAAGKHVFVEKPLALDVAGAKSVVQSASDRDRVLQVGHLLRYHPAVELLLQVAGEQLGSVRYVASQRLNFGSVRSDENVIFSLGPHDLSVMLALFRVPPLSVAAHGAAFVRPGVEDLAFVTLRFPGGGIGEIHLSWLDPHKVRRMTVVGERGMAVFDDMEPREKVRIYDQTVPIDAYATYGENLALRVGDIRIPSYPVTEPLSVEIAHFVNCVATGSMPRTGGKEGILVTEILCAANRSLREGGVPISLESIA